MSDSRFLHYSIQDGMPVCFNHVIHLPQKINVILGYKKESGGNRLTDLVWSEVSNDEFQQDRHSRSLLFTSLYHKSSWKNLPGPKKLSIQHQCLTCQMTTGRKFEHLS
ncbi:hypothetical protein TNCV_2605461 [Trichonephila clavipes]|nr:hypothetical protein TNCV_2605461 [Trichonephila clavipes]